MVAVAVAVVTPAHDRVAAAMEAVAVAAVVVAAVAAPVAPVGAAVHAAELNTNVYRLTIE